MRSARIPSIRHLSGVAFMLAGPHLRLYIHKSFRIFLPHLRGRVCFCLVLFPISSNIYILTCRQSEALSGSLISIMATAMMFSSEVFSLNKRCRDEDEDEMQEMRSDHKVTEVHYLS